MSYQELLRRDVLRQPVRLAEFVTISGYPLGILPLSQARLYCENTLFDA